MSQDESPDVAAEQMLGQYIPLHYHYSMLQDSDRVGAFRQAIEANVRPGMQVVELGGGTGVLSYFATRCGAEVTYVERNPELVETARRLFALNGVEQQVRVVCEDARTFRTNVPVDAVICEMLHVGLLREKQTEVIQCFKDNYCTTIDGPLPRFIPEASVLTVQPVEQDFGFDGYWAPIPLFQAPVADQPRTRALSEISTYSQFCYDESIPQTFAWDKSLIIEQSGEFNALRFITQNLVSINLESGQVIPWANQFMVLPLAEPFAVNQGDAIRIKFDYDAGAEISALTGSLEVAVEQHAPRRMAA